jgi:hypothetical protein
MEQKIKRRITLGTRERILFGLVGATALGIAVSVVGAGGVYLWNGLETGEWNSRKQIEAKRICLEKKQQICNSKKQELDRFLQLTDKLFGINGYADKNKDGAISFLEQVECWRRMGFTNQVYWETRDRQYAEFTQGGISKVANIPGLNREFPTPKLENIERAVQSYEQETKR